MNAEAIAATRPPDRVTYGDHEPTGFAYWTWADRPSLLQALFGMHNWVPEKRERWGRMRFETWIEQPERPTHWEGDTLVIGERPPAQTIGRRYMVPEPRYRPAGSPPLRETCARDMLEDQMGYEAATEYIGHCEAMMGFPSEIDARFDGSRMTQLSLLDIERGWL